jgi:hypothetical protein
MVDSLLGLGLLAAVYVPAFAIVIWLRPPVAIAIPLVSGTTLSLAVVLILAVAHWRLVPFSTFGFRWPGRGQILCSFALAGALSVLPGGCFKTFLSRDPFTICDFLEVFCTCTSRSLRRFRKRSYFEA